MRLSTLSATTLAIGLATWNLLSPHGVAQAAESGACAALADVLINDTFIQSAEAVAAEAFEPPVSNMPGPTADFSRLPAFCRVTGSIRPSPDSDIRFEVWLPEANWNGKFLQTGNGGAAGSIVHASMADPLLRGYAVAHTDTGHQSGGGDFGWAVGHPEKLKDYQYRAVHELTRVGKAITEARYGQVPSKSYFAGCSTGGRQGLKEAQRFPDDYDAIVAGAPASNWSPLGSLSLSIQANLGPGGLGLDKLALLKEAAIAACDDLDGVADRVISDIGACGFDPAMLACASGQSEGCLSESEIAAARRIYAGVVSKTGEALMPGTGPGSEPAWFMYAMPEFSIGTNYYRNVVFNDPDWDPATFDPDRDLARAEQVDGGAADAMDPDLSAFLARGGKLITYHGTTDGLIPYLNSVNYYESVATLLPADVVANGVRFYLVPGMDHCMGGEGAFAIDWLGALEQWAEEGKAPGVLPASHPAMMPALPGAEPQPSRPFTRPACPYPQVATYKGEGDTTDAANFECKSAVTTLTLLGTAGGPGGKVNRAGIASLLTIEGTHYLIDAGEAVARQLARAGVTEPEVPVVFLTHLHNDHTAGLPALSSFAHTLRSKGMALYGPPGTARLLVGLQEFQDVDAGIRIVESGGRLADPKTFLTAQEVGTGLVYDDGRIRVTAAENTHYHLADEAVAANNKSYSYRFETPDRIVVFTGDTGPSAAVEELARGADILVAEMVSASDIASVPPFVVEHMLQEHLTATEVGKLATKAGAGMLVLSHIGKIAPDEVDEIHRHYNGRVVVGEDLMRF